MRLQSLNAGSTDTVAVPDVQQEGRIHASLTYAQGLFVQGFSNTAALPALPSTVQLLQW
jgi:hypothetical protein